MDQYLTEHKLYWPVRSDLIASYKDGSHTNAANNTLVWFKNGRRHRDDDKPAVIYLDGSLGWLKNGDFHRDGDKPAYVDADGRLAWYKNGEQHRDGDKPAAIRADGTLEWFINGIRHRVTGPAVIYSNKKHEYWIDGVEITKEVNAWLKTRKYKVPFTPEQQVEFTLTFS